ncbi:MAG: DUF5107 domain-containing protein, partial [Chloroflexi bacterium]|nr:DUF5107 domain-containing protein [Chloroflexota bacterium]
VLHWANYDATGRTRDDTRTYQILVLENEWLKIWLLPEVGGRIYEIFDKSTGRGLLYRNYVLKPTNWGHADQGWWLAAGGIEWGLPVDEHGYEWGIPWSYEIITGTSGITVTLRDSTAPDRLRAAISVYLPNDRAVLVIHPRLENDRSIDLNFKWWINAMLTPGGMNTVGTSQFQADQNVRFIYPIDQVTIHSTGDDSLPGPTYPGGPTVSMPWPVFGGRDLSYLRNWRQFLGFFARPSAQSDFAAVYNVNSSDPTNKDGMVRIFPHQVTTGLKAFGMGWTNPLPWELWGDLPLHYVELHGGLAPTFWESVSLAAHSAIEWDETWYPVAGLNGLTTGNAEAALNLEQTGSQLIVGLHSTRPHTDAHLRVTRRYTCQVLGDYDLSDVQPGVPITRSIATTWQLQDVSVLFTTDNDQPLLLHQITNDGLAPTNVGIMGPGAIVTQTQIPINLVAMDWDCVRSYDVQVKDGLYGAWSDWLIGAPTTAHTYTGTPGHTYFFRARARDFAGNLSAYGDDLWGNTYTTVLLTPAPVLELSYKLAPAFAENDHSIAYTIVVNNSGSLTATATITDNLPPLTTLITDSLGSSLPPTPTVNGNQITWSGDVPTGTAVTVYYSLQPDNGLPNATVLINTVEIDGGVLPVMRTARVIVNPYRVWLPVIVR